MATGKAIILNGTSSAGKTTLSRALQSTLTEHWWHVPMDAFTAMQPTSPQTAHPSWNAETRLASFLTGYYQCVRALALAGNNVIADAGFLQIEWLREQANALQGIESLYVGVYCPLEELERRERERGDRSLGYARSQYDLVHKHSTYDVAVDTSVLSAVEAAVIIKEALDNPPYPGVLHSIRTDNGGNYSVAPIGHAGRIPCVSNRRIDH